MIQGAFFQRLEGHFIRGYGDRNRNAEIYLIDSAGERAREYLANNEEETQRLQKMSRIIKGFENLYGIELLSIVHWVFKTTQPATEEELIMEVQN